MTCTALAHAAHGPAVASSVSRRDTFCQSFAKLTLYALNEALIRRRSASAAVSRHQIRGPTASAEKTADPSPRSTATAVRTTLIYVGQKLGYRSDVISVVSKCSKMQIFWGSAPDPAEGAYSAPPDPLADREGTRCSPPKNPTPALGLSGLVSTGLRG